MSRAPGFGSASLLIMAAAALHAMAAAAEHAALVFTTIDVPNAAATFPTGINASGEICGFYELTPIGASHPFVRSPAGVITTFDIPGSGLNEALGINDLGQIAGFWSPDLTGNVEHMFFRDASGAITTLDVPGYPINTATGINDGGQMAVNALKEPGPSVPMFRSAAGVYTPIAVAGLPSVYVNGVNNNGVAAGCAYGEGGVQQGFFVPMNAPGAAVTFTVPGSTVTTCAQGINDNNTIVGYYTTGYAIAEASHGFLRFADGTIETLDIPGALGTSAWGINDAGQIAGTWYSKDGKTHGFIASVTHHPHTRPNEP